MRVKAVAAFLLGFLPALAAAQAPPPVPALPDTERRTTYTISGTNCACSVGFNIYGDSTDVDEWIQVWLNGTKYLSTDPTFGWSLSSVTGPLGTIARPITNAILTFNSVQTGTVQIVGARRPRRTSTFAENRGVAARDLNQLENDIVATQRETWDKFGRVIQGQPGDSFNPLPPAANRVNTILGFDGGGNPATLTPAMPIPLNAIEFLMDGGGNALQIGLKGFLEIPVACIIARSTLLATPSGSIVVDVWRTTFTAFDGGATHPVAADKITASAPPTITSGTKAQDTTLSGWTTALSQGDILAFNINSVTTVTLATLSLRCQ